MTSISLHKLTPVLLTVLCLLLPQCSSPLDNYEGKAYTGQVTKVVDGDTLTLITESGEKHRVRLARIDAPERSQKHGPAATGYLKDKVDSQTVTVKAEKTDRYNRLIGEVFVGKQNINEQLVRNGLAWQYTQYDQSSELAELQQAAQNDQLGIWQTQDPTPPWVYRKAKRGK